MENNTIKIDILCPLYNASKDFEKLMTGIKQQENVEIKNIVFPVTESSDNTYELATSIPNAIILNINKEDFSHSLTREQAIKWCTSDVVIFMSQDVYLSDKNALYNLAKSIDGNVAHAFARQITKSKGIEKYTRQKNYPLKSYVMTAKDIERKQIKTFYSSDACSAYNRQVFEELKGFDGKKFQVSEDMYYCRKAILAGYSIKYCAESVVTHSHTLTLRQLYKRYYDIGMFFAQNPEFKQYKSTDSGLKLAFYVLGQALKHFDIPVVFRWAPDMITRYIGKRKGEKEFMIKNVIVVNDYDYVQGGASLVAIEQANLLFKKGYNVIFFCAISNKEKSVLNSKIKIVATNEFDSLSNPNKIKGMLQGANNKQAYLKMYRILSDLNPNETVVSIHGYTKALSTSFIRACKRKHVKTILTAHDYFSICPNGGLFNYKKNCICHKQGTLACKFCNCDSRNYLFKMYRNYRFNKQNRKFKFRDNIDCLVTISDTNEKLLKDYFPKTKIIRIYNPTSIDIKEDRIKCELNDSYIYVGRIDKEKGIDYLCESFKNTNKKLVLIGSGSEYETLKCKYESEYIKFLGWLKHDEVINEMKKARALIFPCLLYEGAPLTIFEAQSQGLPCIVSKYSNASDFIDEKNGWVYNPFDSSLSNILNGLKNKDIYNKSNNSYNIYWKNPFDKEKYINALINLFLEISN